MSLQRQILEADIEQMRREDSLETGYATLEDGRREIAQREAYLELVRKAQERFERKIKAREEEIHRAEQEQREREERLEFLQEQLSDLERLEEHSTKLWD
jgi:DNA-binding protein H-NS